MKANSLCKEERLRGEKTISNLFERGRSFFMSPYKVFWMKTSEPSDFPTRFAVSAPRRRFKRAVKRNLLKRRTREAFRTNKRILNDALAEGQVQLMVIYSSDRLLDYAEIEGAMQRILQRIAESS